jgi:formiminoglutamase
MTWTSTHYSPPTSTNWQGRADAPADTCFFQVIRLMDMRQDIPTHISPAFGLLGFCCDEGVRRNLGRAGAAAGPGALREVLAKLPTPYDKIICYDAGDITCTDGDLEGAQQALGEAVARLLAQRITPIVIGGGHEMAWGHYQGIAKVCAQQKTGIVNFDAHYDMRPLLPDNKGSSGTPFLQIAAACSAANHYFDYNCIGIQHTGNTRPLFDTAKHYGVKTLYAEELHQSGVAKYLHFVDRVINANEKIYLTLCLDVLSAAYAPGVSAPQPLGLTPWQILPFLHRLAASGKIISYDIAELAPKYDFDNRTARLAASLVYEIIRSGQ